MKLMLAALLFVIGISAVSTAPAVDVLVCTEAL